MSKKNLTHPLYSYSNNKKSHDIIASEENILQEMNYYNNHSTDPIIAMGTEIINEVEFDNIDLPRKSQHVQKLKI